MQDYEVEDIVEEFLKNLPIPRCTDDKQHRWVLMWGRETESHTFPFEWVCINCEAAQSVEDLRKHLDLPDDKKL